MPTNDFQVKYSLLEHVLCYKHSWKHSMLTLAGGKDAGYFFCKKCKLLISRRRMQNILKGNEDPVLKVILQPCKAK